MTDAEFVQGVADVLEQALGAREDPLAHRVAAHVEDGPEVAEPAFLSIDVRPVDVLEPEREDGQIVDPLNVALPEPGEVAHLAQGVKKLFHAS